jgi:hypothetical protein
LDPYYSELFSIYNYFLNITKELENIKLNETQKQYLYLFAIYPHISPYDIDPDKKIKDSSGEIINSNSNAYRQAKNIVRKLYQLKLIDRDTIIEEKNLHNKTFYSLTELGLFYIMKLSIFLKINIQNIITSFSDLQMFKDLLYPFIKKETICSPDFPKSILFLISLYIQKYYFRIEDFISLNKNKTDWSETRLIVLELQLQDYLIKKYKNEHKYKWLENAEISRNNEDTEIKFFNLDKPQEYLKVQFRESKTRGYLIDRSKKTKKETTTEIPNIKKFIWKRSFSNEEGIGRAFSTYYSCNSFEFISSILSAFPKLNFDTAMLFFNDKKFIQSLDKAKKQIDKTYMSIKNPYEYSLDSSLQKDLLGDIYSKKLKPSDNPIFSDNIT